MSWAYLAILVASLGCMVLCDWRWKLALFLRPARAVAVMALVVSLFIAWDALGIVTGAFYRGDSAYMTGIELAPEFPIEELFFLTFLSYLTLNLVSGVRLIREAT